MTLVPTNLNFVLTFGFWTINLLGQQQRQSSLTKKKKSDIKTSDKASFHVEVINAQSCSSANEEGHLKYHLDLQPGEFKEVVYLNSSLHTAENPNCSFYKSLFLQLPG